MYDINRHRIAFFIKSRIQFTDGISTETIHVNIPEHEDFEIINSFANKMLTEATSIDEEIQNVINDHFWDML